MTHLRHILFILLLGSAGCLVALFLLSIAFPLPPLKPYSVLVEDRNGKILYAFLADDGQWRLRTPPSEIPERLKRVLIEREDRFFLYHPGINPLSLIRALAQNIMSGKRVSGASTITMQVARMLEPKERSYANKAIEMFRAVQLECTYSKGEILEMYLSMVPLGGNIEGLKSASLLYYQTPLERLNIAQLLDLILIPNDPNDLRPDKNAGQLYERRLAEAARWLRRGYLSRQDSIIIWQTSAVAERREQPRLAPHFSLRLKQRHFQTSELRGSLDLQKQRVVETLLSHQLQSWKPKGVRNGAVVVVANSTREVLAYVGSADFNDKESQGEIDAVRALRSPGSTLKPFLCALQMERGNLTPKTRLLDVPYDVEGYRAENYDGTYSGLVYADEALHRSLNVPMVRILQETGVPDFLELTEKVGMVSLHPQKEKLGLSMILGGCGVTLEEMVGAYATMANGGLYLPLNYVVSKNDSRAPPKQVFSTATAFMLTEILAGLDRPDLPNNFESSLNLPRIAFKTGTSYGRRDAWAIGYSAEYTVGVWIGNVTNTGSSDLMGSKAAAPLLIDIFNSISSSHQKTIIPTPKDIRLRDVCVNSGQVPTPRCRHLVEDYYSASRTVPRYCEVDNEYMVSKDGMMYYCTTCVESHPFVFRVIPGFYSELLSFWERVGKPYQKPPPHNPECTRLFAGQGPKILSPTGDMTYIVVSPIQKIVLQAASGVDVKRHTWFLNDQVIAYSTTDERVFITPKTGEQTITCTDDKGRSSRVHLIVKRL